MNMSEWNKLSQSSRHTAASNVEMDVSIPAKIIVMGLFGSPRCVRVIGVVLTISTSPWFRYGTIYGRFMYMFVYVRPCRHTWSDVPSNI